MCFVKEPHEHKHNQPSCLCFSFAAMMILTCLDTHRRDTPLLRWVLTFTVSITPSLPPSLHSLPPSIFYDCREAKSHGFYNPALERAHFNPSCSSMLILWACASAQLCWRCTCTEIYVWDTTQETNDHLWLTAPANPVFKTSAHISADNRQAVIFHSREEFSFSASASVSCQLHVQAWGYVQSYVNKPTSVHIFMPPFCK